MRASVRIAIVMPAGPRDDVADTLESILRYSDPSRVILVIDDTQGSNESFQRMCRRHSADVVVMPAPAGLPAGCFGGLWTKMAAAFGWLLENYQPQLVMRIDTDALLLGEGLEERAERVFASNPLIGLLGSYRIGPDGGQRDFSWPARQIRSTAGFRGRLHPRRRSVVRRYLELARSHGYVDGEHVLGAAYILSNSAIRAIEQNGWLASQWPPSAMIGDDHIVSMLTAAAGYQIEDFGGPADPMALKWVGLPAHPAELLAQGKLVTHSVRSWQHLSEAEIRGIFAAARE